jgi:hypothetical protein
MAVFGFLETAKKGLDKHQAQYYNYVKRKPPQGAPKWVIRYTE